MPTLHRLRQFSWALEAHLRPPGFSPLGEYLSREEVAAFQRLLASDRLHSLRVLAHLRRREHEEQELLRAALLHDIGKGASGLRLWHRVAIVLLKNLARGTLAEIAQATEPGSWRYPFHAHLHHAERGAEMAEELDCSPLLIRLIREHHLSSSTGGQDGEAQMLAALQEADRCS